MHRREKLYKPTKHHQQTQWAKWVLHTSPRRTATLNVVGGVYSLDMHSSTIL